MDAVLNGMWFRASVALVFAFLIAAPVAADPVELEATARYLDDGDSFVIHLRSQGIDAPEKAQECADAEGQCYPCGVMATDALYDLVTFMDGDRVRFHRMDLDIWEVDGFGRPVVTAYVDGVDVHLEMVRQGWAVAYRQYLPEPLEDSYIAAEAEAKAAGRGMWQGDFIEPRLWRNRGGAERLPCEED